MSQQFPKIQKRTVIHNRNDYLPNSNNAETPTIPRIKISAKIPEQPPNSPSSPVTQPKQQHSKELLEYFKKLKVQLQFIESSNNSVVSAIKAPQIPEFGIEGIVVKEIKHNNDGTHSDQCKDLGNEMQILKSLQHPNIIKMHKEMMFQFPRSCAIFLPQAKCDLFDYMLEYSSIDHPNGLNPIKICFKQIANAIQYMHSEKNLIHGDIKPDNIFVFSETDFRLADFGFSKQKTLYSNNNPSNSINNNQIQKQKEHQNLGTREDFLRFYQQRSLKYLPPEFVQIIEGDEFQLDTVDEHSADVFGLGISLFQVLFKSVPSNEEASVYCEIPQPKLPSTQKIKVQQVKRKIKRQPSPKTEGLINHKNIIKPSNSIKANQNPILKYSNESSSSHLLNSEPHINQAFKEQKRSIVEHESNLTISFDNDSETTILNRENEPKDRILEQQQQLCQVPVKKVCSQQYSTQRKYYFKGDPLYELLYYPNKTKQFWKFFESEIRGLKSTSLEIIQLKDLIHRCITPFQYLRISIEDFISHPWLNIEKN